MGACYEKPIALRGYGEVGVNPLSSPIEIYMACWQWGAYLGPGSALQGCRRLCWRFLDAHRSEHVAGHVQGGRKLHELAIDPHGSRR